MIKQKNSQLNNTVVSSSKGISDTLNFSFSLLFGVKSEKKYKKTKKRKKTKKQPTSEQVIFRFYVYF